MNKDSFEKYNASCNSCDVAPADAASGPAVVFVDEVGVGELRAHFLGQLLEEVDVFAHRTLDVLNQTLQRRAMP